jgi:hypothetical protein
LAVDNNFFGEKLKEAQTNRVEVDETFMIVALMKPRPTLGIATDIVHAFLGLSYLRTMLEERG